MVNNALQGSLDPSFVFDAVHVSPCHIDHLPQGYIYSKQKYEEVSRASKIIVDGAEDHEDDIDML